MRLTIILLLTVLGLHFKKSNTTDVLPNNFFTHQDLKLPDQIQQRFASIVQQFEGASDQQLLNALCCVKSYLHHILLSLDHNSLSINKRYIINCRLKHIEVALDRSKHALSWWKRSHHYLEHAYQSLRHRCSSTTQWKKLCTFDPLASALLEYITIENEYILITYHKTLNFFSLLNKYQKLPFILNFWSDPTLQKELAFRLSSNITTKVYPQALAAVGEFIANQALHLAPVALQATIMGGQSMYGQWISKKAQKKMAALAEQQKKLGSSYQEFIVQQNDNQAKKVASIVKNFTQAQQAINDSYKKFAHVEQQNYAYLLQSINLEQPKSHYLQYPISFDQLFGAGVMNTPLKEQYPWYNIYQQLSGNWGFYKGCFYQRSIVAYGKPYWDGGSTNPEAVAIFNEWNTAQFPYNLTIEMRIIQTNYPFFIGVMFNKARWISGDPERMSCYQLLGLYAPTKENLAFWYATQSISFDEGVETIITPLHKIATNKAQLIKAINPIKAKVLINTSITYRIELIVDKKIVKYCIKEKNIPERMIAMGTFLNPEKSARYHGFGFIAAGCQACFTIIEPTQLRYVQ